MKYLVQAIGSFACGKSRLISSVGMSYGVNFSKNRLFNSSDRCIVAGYYAYRYFDGQYTGGMDAITLKKDIWISKIEKLCNSEQPIACFEGTLSNIYKNAYEWYDNLPREKLVIYLNVPIETLIERITIRGRRQISKKRITHLEEKIGAAESFFEHAKDIGYNTFEVEFTTDDAHIETLKWIEDTTGIKMDRYILKPERKTLFEVFGREG